jgi:hypothetical protein
LWDVRLVADDYGIYLHDVLEESAVEPNMQKRKSSAMLIEPVFNLQW